MTPSGAGPGAAAGRSAVMVVKYFPLPPSTGGSKRAVRLLEAMQRAGLVPCVVAMERPSDLQLDDAASRGWRVVTPASEQPISPAARLALHVRGDVEARSPELGERIRALARDAAFVQFEEILTFQYAGSVPSGVAVVMSSYNVDSLARFPAAAGLRPWYQKLRMQRAERAAALRADAVLCVSDFDRRHFERIGARRTLLVPNGVDPALLEIPASAPAADDQEILFFGTLTYPPNLDGITRFLERSWPAVAARRPGARLRIVGVGPAPELAELARQTDGAELVGAVEAIEPELRRARLVVTPIWFGGGTRIKVLEAMAAGRAVVGTTFSVEGVGFEHGIHGLLSDDDQALAADVVSLLEDAEAAARLGRHGRALAQRYRWEAATEEAVALYRELGALEPATAA